MTVVEQTLRYRPMDALSSPLLETPAAALPLAQRVAAQAALLQLLSKYLVTTAGGY